MIYLRLLLTFLKIGAVSFGGGYGMLSMMREEVLSHEWLTDNEFLNFIAVAESTPGPIAINMATFIGSSQGGLFGAVCATLGVVLPSLIIIMCIAAFAQRLLKRAGVRAAINGVQPAIIGMLLATAISMLILVVLGVSTVGTPITFDPRALVIFAALATLMIVYKHFKKRAFSPILLILIAGGLGMLLYSI